MERQKNQNGVFTLYFSGACGFPTRHYADTEVQYGFDGRKIS